MTFTNGLPITNSPVDRRYRATDKFRNTTTRRFGIGFENNFQSRDEKSVATLDLKPQKEILDSCVDKVFPNFLVGRIKSWPLFYTRKLFGL